MPNLSTKTPIEQINNFNNHFSTLKDPRRTSSGHFYYPLDEILFLTISAVISGYDTLPSIQLFGETKQEWLRTFFPYKEGIPPKNVLREVFTRLDPIGFGKCFVKWINTVSILTDGEVVAIDGKTIRGSAESGKTNSAIHVVSAYASENHLCLGQEIVDKKENEIIAIPRLLEILAIKGCTVTIDAMGCQKTIAEAIIDQGADYILMVKDNQKELKNQIEKIFKLQSPNKQNETTDAGHGRVETRVCEALDDLTFMDDKQAWPMLKSIVRVKSTRHIKRTKVTSQEIRYYITSLDPEPSRLNKAIRSHWSIENNLHWILDVAFNEDSARRKKDNSPANFNIIYKIALALIEKETSYKASKNLKRARAALDDKYREILLTCHGKLNPNHYV